MYHTLREMSLNARVCVIVGERTFGNERNDLQTKGNVNSYTVPSKSRVGVTKLCFITAKIFVAIYAKLISKVFRS